MENIKKEDLIDFEKRIENLFKQGKIPYLIHLSGGNEDQLIEIFKEINKGDYIFSGHRSHYHYLLAGGSKEELEKKIMNGRSMFVFDKNLNFLSSAIVAGNTGIAAGVAWALKKKGSDRKVWCFLGDGAEDEGHFYEAVRYVEAWDLQCTFIIEDNNLSVKTPKSERNKDYEINWPKGVRRYHYTPIYPHAGIDGWIDLSNAEIKEQFPLEKKEYSIDLEEPIEKINYKEEIKKAMEFLAEDEKTIFVGYNVKYDAAYGTLRDIPDHKKLETPLAENLMTGLAMGLSLEGFKPVLFFERHDFMLDAVDAIVNHMDKFEVMSEGQFKFPVIIKSVVGSKKPIYAGITHTQDFTEAFKKLLSFPVFELNSPKEVLKYYKLASTINGPVMLVEKKALFNMEE